MSTPGMKIFSKGGLPRRALSPFSTKEPQPFVGEMDNINFTVELVSTTKCVFYEAFHFFLLVGPR
jgi:hypothetical protein